MSDLRCRTRGQRTKMRESKVRRDEDSRCYEESFQRCWLRKRSFWAEFGEWKVRPVWLKSGRKQIVENKGALWLGRKLGRDCKRETQGRENPAQLSQAEGGSGSTAQ